MVVLMLLGIVLVFHYITVDTQKAVAIAQEGQIMKNTLAIEGSKSADRNVILLSAYDAIILSFRKDLQLPGENTDTIEGLKAYLEKRILSDLNSVRSINPNDINSGAGALGAYDNVTIDYKDDKGNIRKDGFMVRTEGTDYGVPVKIEKFVDSRVFYFMDKAKHIKSQFTSNLSAEIRCKLGMPPTYSFESDSMLGCNKGVAICLTYQSYQSAGALYTPGDYFFDGQALVDKIKESVISLAKKNANKEAFPDLAKDDILVEFSVDHIDSNIEIKKQTPASVCCHWITKTSNGVCGYQCVEYKKNQDMEVVITGNIYVKQLKVIDDATLKQKGEGNFEICAKDPIMTKGGEFKVQEVDLGEFSIPYEIHMLYSTGECNPRDVKNNPGKYQAGIETKFSPGKVQIGVSSGVPSYEFNADSLQYTNNVKCNWDSGYNDACQQPNYANQCGCLTVIDAQC